MKFTFFVVVLAVFLTVAFAELSEEDRKTLEEYKRAEEKCKLEENETNCLNVKIGIQKPNGSYDNEKGRKINKMLDNVIKEKIEQMEKIKKSIGECIANPATNVCFVNFKRFVEGNATDEDKIKVAKYLFCVHGKRGFQKPNGDYDIDNIRKSSFEPTFIDELIATCGTRPAGSSAETAALALFKCIQMFEINKKIKLFYL